MKVTATESGLLVEGALGHGKIGWPDLYLARIEAHTVSFIFLNQKRGDRTNHVRVPFAEALEVLRSPFFPKWLVNPRQAVKEGLTENEAKFFGPPPTASWIEGVTSPGAEGFRPETNRMRAWFGIGVSRVGVFDKGVAFDTTRHDLDIVALRGLVASSSRSVGDRYWFGIVNVDPEGSLAYVVTSVQARAILELRPKTSWGLPDSVWMSLGMDTSGRVARPALSSSSKPSA